ncbi:hypothetical protein BKH43_02255 [Helicobacter sp. 13S00401-1]|uniref:hypothetical protein n=1 Tax=Helicobacter sp. 13S00401-1 TaxID=1905758 RepID=UPI000BD0DACA|nr:hypothetical protein [Helicobacter sp. 13S00401-1]PAF51053.1 hypothetical protein BKH43_02255 [Helicobacter sp. 13S00401-1]
MKEKINRRGVLKASTLLAFAPLAKTFLGSSLLASDNTLEESFKGWDSKKAFSIDPATFKYLTSVDKRYLSYNIEMVEIVGGKFWAPYKDLDSKITSTNLSHDNSNLYKALKPLDLQNEKLRMLASSLGKTYVRVSGTWANTIYFQDDDKPKLKSPPKGFENVLTRKEWKGVIDFIKATNSKLVTSFAISSGTRDKDGIWTPKEAIKIANYTKKLGGKIAAAEFFNEPNLLSVSGAPKGYNAQSFANDIAVFTKFVKANLPRMITLGPGCVGEGGALPANMSELSSKDLLSAKPNPKFDAFSYHYYGAASMRCVGEGKEGGTSLKDALSFTWLDKSEHVARFYSKLRDEFMPKAPLWVTETADSACGGNPWASTFYDTFRFLNQLGSLAKAGVKVVMHNTLCASEYGLLDYETYEPRPNYYAALLWQKLMGEKVYEVDIKEPSLRIYAHSLKGTTQGRVMMIINPTERIHTFDFKKAGEIYVLAPSPYHSNDPYKTMQNGQVSLNGVPLGLKDDKLLELKGSPLKAGRISILPYAISFISFKDI